MKSRGLLALVALVGAATALEPSRAAANEDLDQAKALFNAGAQAYNAARYQDAVESFEAAYKKAPRAAILFSLAQAYRRLYAIDQKPESLRAAIANYRRYLDETPDGGRRADAAQDLSELEVVAARLTPGAPPAAAPSVVESKPRTRINITSSTPGARISLDDQPSVAAPLIREVSPGKHKIAISAEGYFAEEREIVAVEGDSFGLDRDLRERPARIDLRAPAGAQVTLDGRFVGTTPLPAIEVAQGRRFLAVVKNGYKPFSRELVLLRGQSQVVTVELSADLQRKLAYGLFTAAGLSAGAGLATLIGALGAQRKAQEIANQRNQAPITESDLTSYHNYLSDRDQAGRATAAFWGSTGFLGLLGFALYAFDMPTQPVPPLRTEPTPTREIGPAIDLAVAPLLGPSVAGAALTARF